MWSRTFRVLLLWPCCCFRFRIAFGIRREGQCHMLQRSKKSLRSMRWVEAECATRRSSQAEGSIIPYRADWVAIVCRTPGYSSLGWKDAKGKCMWRAWSLDLWLCKWVFVFLCMFVCMGVCVFLSLHFNRYCNGIVWHLLFLQTIWPTWQNTVIGSGDRTRLVLGIAM